MSCLRTYATLRIFSSSAAPDDISALLGLRPTETRPIDPASRHRHERESHYWAWSTRDRQSSTDGLDHIDAVIAALEGKEHALQQLRDMDCDIDISCLWESSGQGGPCLDRQTIHALARLDLEIWWDVYFGDASEGGATPSPDIGARPSTPD